MALRQWANQAGATIDFWHHYCQGDPNHPKVRGRPPSVNRLLWDETAQKHVTPDGLLGLTHAGQSRLFFVELHHKTPTAQVIAQIYRNFLARKAARQKVSAYPIKQDPYVLSVFTSEAIKSAVEKRLADDQTFDAVRPGLLLRTLDQIRAEGVRLGS